MSEDISDIASQTDYAGALPDPEAPSTVQDDSVERSPTGMGAGPSLKKGNYTSRRNATSSLTAAARRDDRSQTSRSFFEPIALANTASTLDDLNAMPKLKPGFKKRRSNKDSAETVSPESPRAPVERRHTAPEASEVDIEDSGPPARFRKGHLRLTKSGRGFDTPRYASTKHAFLNFDQDTFDAHQMVAKMLSKLLNEEAAWLTSGQKGSGMRPLLKSLRLKVNWQELSFKFELATHSGKTHDYESPDLKSLAPASTFQTVDDTESPTYLIGYKRWRARPKAYICERLTESLGLVSSFVEKAIGVNCDTYDSPIQLSGLEIEPDPENGRLSYSVVTAISVPGLNPESQRSIELSS